MKNRIDKESHPGWMKVGVYTALVLSYLNCSNTYAMPGGGHGGGHGGGGHAGGGHAGGGHSGGGHIGGGGSSGSQPSRPSTPRPGGGGGSGGVRPSRPDTPRPGNGGGSSGSRPSRPNKPQIPGGDHNPGRPSLPRPGGGGESGGNRPDRPNKPQIPGGDHNPGRPSLPRPGGGGDSHPNRPDRPGRGSGHGSGVGGVIPEVRRDRPERVVERPDGRRFEKFPDGGLRLHRPDRDHDVQVDRRGGRTEIDREGRAVARTRGARKIEYHDGNRITVNMGRRRSYNQTVVVNNRTSIRVVNRSYRVDHDPYLGRSCQYNRFYRPVASRYWGGRPLYFGNPWAYSFAAGFSWGFFWGENLSPSYRCSWGYDYWTSPGFISNPWYGYYGGTFWRPYGYWYRDRDFFYTPAVGLLDFIMAELYELAYEDQLDRIRQRVRLRLEQELLDQDEEVLKQRVEEESSKIAQEEADRIRSLHPEPAIGQGGYDQFLGQVNQVAKERQADLPVSDAFTKVLETPGYLFVVSDAPEDNYGAGSKSCQLNVGDVVQLVSYIPGVGVTMQVKTSHLDSCDAGSEIIVDVEDVLNWYNDFLEKFDLGGQKLLEDAGAGKALPPEDTSPQPGEGEEIPQPTPMDPYPSAPSEEGCKCSGAGCCSIQ